MAFDFANIVQVAQSFFQVVHGNEDTFRAEFCTKVDGQPATWPT